MAKKEETKQPEQEAPKSEAVLRAEDEARKADLDNRVKAFNAKLIPLLAEYKLALGAEPQYARTPEGFYVTVARPTVLDDSKTPVAPPEKEAPAGGLGKVD